MNSTVINKVDMNYLQGDVVLAELALLIPILQSSMSPKYVKRTFLDGKNPTFGFLNAVYVYVDEKESSVEVWQSRDGKDPLLLMRYY